MKETFNLNGRQYNNASGIYWISHIQFRSHKKHKPQLIVTNMWVCQECYRIELLRNIIP